VTIFHVERAEAAADADQHGVDLAHAGGGADRDREEARHRAHRDLRARADAEPHQHHREEHDLGRRAEVEQQRLERVRQEPVGAERDADGEPGEAADHDRDPISIAVTPRFA
jgi:hypothetical protein